MLLISQTDAGIGADNHSVVRARFQTGNSRARRSVNDGIERIQAMSRTKCDGIGCGIRRGSCQGRRCDIDFRSVKAETYGIAKRCGTGKVNDFVEGIRGTPGRKDRDDFRSITATVGRELECAACLINNNISESDRKAVDGAVSFIDNTIAVG